jgi:hypothetical protein
MFPTNREIWESIGGYGNYEVSWYGRVRNVTTGRILKGSLNSSGYLNVTSCKNGKKKTHYIHKLVAQEWIENTDSKHCVDHINCDRTNNHHDNLRWATYTENSRKKSKSINASSSYYGVCWNSSRKQWKAKIKIAGTNLGLGQFEDEKEEAKAFNAAAAAHFGDFARLNTFTD